MNNKPGGSRPFPGFRDPDYSMGRPDRYRVMPERLSYQEILRSRSTVSFDRGRPYDSPSMLQESEPYGRGRREMYGPRESYGYDSSRPGPMHSELSSRNFRTDPNSRLNPLYSERELLERERLLALRNRNSQLEDSGSSYNRSRLMDTSMPMPYRQRVPDESLREKFANHMRNEMMQLSKELPPSRFGLGLPSGNASLRREDLEEKELQRDSLLRNSHPQGQNYANVGSINESSLPRDLLWNNDKAPAEFLGLKETASYPVGVRIKDIPPENLPWEEKRALPLENRLLKDDQLSDEELNSVKVPFSSELSSQKEAGSSQISLGNVSVSSQSSLGNVPVSSQSSLGNVPVSSQSSLGNVPVSSPSSLGNVPVSSQLSLGNAPVSTTQSTVAETSTIDTSEQNNYNPNNPVYSDAYIRDLVRRQPPAILDNNSAELSSAMPFSEDSSQKVAKEDPIPFDQYPDYSIPFLGETVSALDTGTASESKDEKVLNQVQKEDGDSILSNSNHSNSGENDKMKSTLEHALETLMLNEPIVGLDYIIEYKDIVSSDGGFPFYCNLCKSSISRSLIIDHVKGFKHGLKYLKIKNANACDYVLNHIKNQEEKEEYVYKAMEHLENSFGKGHVVVKLKSSERKESPVQISFGKISSNASSPASVVEKSSTVKPLTLSQIEEISQDSNMFGEENSSCSSQQNSSLVNKEPEGKDAINCIPKVEIHLEITESDGKVSENVTGPILDNKSLKRPADSQRLCESVKMLKTEDSRNLNSKNGVKEVGQNNFDVAILDKLSQCSITNEEDANVVRKVVGTLLKLLLQYNLQHIAAEDRTRLINEVQSRPFQTMEKLQELLKHQNQPAKEDDKVRLNSDFSIRGKNLAFSPDNATQPTSMTKLPIATGSISPSQPPGVPPKPAQNQGLPVTQGNVNHPPNKLPLPPPNSLPPPPPDDPIPPPPLPPPGSNISLPPPPPPLPPEVPRSKPPLPPAPSQTIPLPPPSEMKKPILPPPHPMAPPMGSSAYFPNPYQLPNVYAGVANQHHGTQSNRVPLATGSSMMQSVGAMLVPTTGNMMTPHFIAMSGGMMPNQTSALHSHLSSQTPGLLPNQMYPEGATMLPSHRYAMLQPPPMPPS